MGIKENTEFRHKKGGEYDFLTILHPISEKPKHPAFITQEVFHTELQRDITIYNYSVGNANYHTSGVCYSEVDEYLVLYQSKEDLDAEHLYARPIQMFFEHVKEADGTWVRRFEELKR
jgi:hypothetical protein